jgi:tetratricopeptide (TPR) repeat protein
MASTDPDWVARGIAMLALLLGGGGILGWVKFRSQLSKDNRDEYVRSFNSQIEAAERRGDKEEVNRVGRQLENFQEAWRSKNNLKLMGFGGQIPPLDQSVPTRRDDADQVQESLNGLETYPGIVATAEDHFLKGNAHVALGQFDEAIRSYTLSLGLKQHGATYGNRGVAFLRQGDSLSAMSDYNRAIGLASKDARWSSNRGNLYTDIGDYSAALKDLNEAVTLDPKLREARNNRGRAYIQLSELDRAIKDFDDLIVMEPQYAAAFANRGAAYGDLRDFDRAIPDYTKAIALDPGQSQSFTNRGNAYRAQGKLDLALMDLNRAVELAPEDSIHYSNRSAVYIEMDELDLALGDCRKSLELNPDNADALYNFACICSKQDEIDKAVEYLSRAVGLNPGAIQQARVDLDLRRLREDPRGQELLGG